MRTVLHSDINNCFASIELLHRPALREKPVAVCGDEDARHGIVLAKNQLAKRFGIKTGQVIWQAKQLCPELVVIPPNYPLYLRFCRDVREIYCNYTDRIEPFGIDECWLDTSASVTACGDGMKIAEELRRRIKFELGITVSVGVSWNKIFAKLGSDLRKPDAVTRISQDSFREQIWPLPASELLYVGRATDGKLSSYGIRTIGQIATADVDFMHRTFGKMGDVLSAFANGLDSSPVSEESAEPVVKSIGNSTTPPRDMQTQVDVSDVLLILSESVASRLRENGFLCRGVQIHVRDSSLYSFERQLKLERPSAISPELHRAALKLFAASYSWLRPVRSIGVRATDLIPASAAIQLSLCGDEERRLRREKLERAADGIRSSFGDKAIFSASALRDPLFSGLTPAESSRFHPVGYFKSA